MLSNPNQLRPKLHLPQQTPTGVNATLDKAPPSDSATANRNLPDLQKIALDMLSTSGQRRLNSDVVDELAESFSIVKQIQPVSVRQSGKNPEKYEVICGFHRVAAARKLNWPSIDALVFEGDELDLPLIEIAENLHRKELSVYEKACLHTKWLKLAQQKGEQTAQPGGVQPHDKGYSKAARMLGRGTTREEIRRSEKIASIADEVIPYLVNHGLENHQSALLDIAKGQTASDQINIAREYANRGHKTGGSRAKPPTGAATTVERHKIQAQALAPASTCQMPALPAFLDRRDTDKMMKSLVEEWASCRLRVLLLDASEVVRNQFLHETVLAEFAGGAQPTQSDRKAVGPEGESR